MKRLNAKRVCKTVFLAALILVSGGTGAIVQRHRDAVFMARAFNFPSVNFKANVDRGAAINTQCMNFMRGGK
jgi:hypothetical protein